VPVQAPVQPANEAPAAADVLNETDVPWMKLALQVGPQLIPPGELVTVPNAEPVPDLLTCSANVGAFAKLALTDTADVPIVNVQLPVPEQAPPQPANT